MAKKSRSSVPATDSTTAPPPRPRHWRRRATLWLAFSILAGGAGYTVWQEQQKQQAGQVQPLEGWVQADWRIVAYPDRPGPYEKIGESTVYLPGEAGLFTYRTPEGPVSHRISAKSGVMQQVLLLKTPDGELTLASLER